MRRYTPKEISFIKRHVSGRSYIELAELFNMQRFGEPVTASQMKGILSNIKLKTGRDCRFKKGQSPYTKGRKLWYATKGFKPGHKAWNYMPVGSEKIAGGYVFVKVSERKKQVWKNWKAKHVLIWEKARGKVPKGYMVIFADGDKTNFSLGNLRLISRKENAVMNRYGLRSVNAGLTDAGKIVADIKIAVAGRKRSLKKRGR